MTPSPVGSLFLHFDFDERMIPPVPFDKVLTVVMVLVVIPVVVIPVVAVVDTVAIAIVAPMLLLVPVIRPLGGVTPGRWGCKGCGEKNRTNQKSISAVNIDFLLGQGFLSGIFGQGRVCGGDGWN